MTAKKKIIKLGKNIIILIVSIILILLVTEIVIRVIVGPYSTQDGNCIASKKFSQKYYRYQKDALRQDKEFSTAKDKNVFRILVLGDSFTFGQGLKSISDTYPKILENKLNSMKSDTRYEVINAGQMALETVDELNFLKAKGLAYQPDIIILGYVYNDAIPDPAPDSSGMNISLFRQIHGKIYSNSYLLCVSQINKILSLEYIKDSFTQKEYNDEVNNILYWYSGENLKKHRQDLEELIGIAHNNGTPIVIMMFPFTLDVNNRQDYQFKQVHSILKDIAENKSAYFIDLYTEFSKAPIELSLRVNKQDNHPNELAHKIAAKTLFNFLVREKLVQISAIDY